MAGELAGAGWEGPSSVSGDLSVSKRLKRRVGGRPQPRLYRALPALLGAWRKEQEPQMTWRLRREAWARPRQG